MKKLSEYLLVLLLLSPLLFINIRDSHDWGDDFAGYLRQAKNISEGKPFYQSKFEYRDYNPSYAPPYYSYGFPMLLAPVVKVWGLDFKVLDRYMSLWQVAWALLIFSFLRRHFSLPASASFILIFFWNPYFFDFKTNVNSDIPFSFFFLLTILLYRYRKGKPLYYHALTGLVFAFMLGIRSAGMIIIPVIMLEFSLHLFRFLSGELSKEDIKSEFIETGTALVSAAAFVTVFNVFLFRPPADTTAHFIGLFMYGHYWDVVLKNLDVYTNEFINIFQHDTGKYSFAVHYTSAFMLVLFVIGFINSLRYGFEIMALVAFSLMVMLFPFPTQGFRYFLPVLPVIIFCIIRGAASVRTSRAYRPMLAVFFVVFIVLQYKKEVHTMRENQGAPIWPGPFTEDNRAALDHIRANVPDTALIACLKPRAVELFTNKMTCVLPAGTDVPDIANTLKTAKPTYILSIKDLGAEADEVAAYRKDSLIWENKACSLYLCNNK